MKKRRTLKASLFFTPSIILAGAFFLVLIGFNIVVSNYTSRIAREHINSRFSIFSLYYAEEENWEFKQNDSGYGLTTAYVVLNEAEEAIDPCPPWLNAEEEAMTAYIIDYYRQNRSALREGKQLSFTREGRTYHIQHRAYYGYYAYVEHLVRLSEREWNDAKASQQKEADTCKRRLEEMNTLLQRIYENHVFGRLSDERYAAMSANYEAEMTQMKTRYTEIQMQLSTYARKTRSAKVFADLVEQYTNITEVTAELLHTLIDKIVVHEKEVIDGQIIMRVDIHYRFIGKVGSMDGEDLQAPKIRRNTKLLMEAGVFPTAEA